MYDFYVQCQFQYIPSIHTNAYIWLNHVSEIVFMGHALTHGCIQLLLNNKDHISIVNQSG